LQETKKKRANDRFLFSIKLVKNHEQETFFN
jgi:hypothetical protein